MSEQKQQGSPGASSPSVNAPAKVPAAGCDESVRAKPRRYFCEPCGDEHSDRFYPCKAIGPEERERRRLAYLATLPADHPFLQPTREEEIAALRRRASDIEADCLALHKMLHTATVRIEILLGRMRACDADGHGLSLFEGEAWVKDQRALLLDIAARAALSSVPPRSETSQRAGEDGGRAETKPAGARSEPIASASEPPASTGERGAPAPPRILPCGCVVCLFDDEARCGPGCPKYRAPAPASGERSPRAGTAVDCGCDRGAECGGMTCEGYRAPPPRSSGTTASEGGWCPNTTLRIPKGECGCCEDPDSNPSTTEG